MLRWLRKLLGFRKNCCSPVGRVLECYKRSSNGSVQRTTVEVVSRAGSCLIVLNPLDHRDMFVMNANQAIDPELYWRIWKDLLGDAKIEWEK